MVTYTLRLFGIPVFSLEVIQFALEDGDEEGAARIEGGSAHNFERDFEPLSATSHHEWEWEDKKRFGFG
jgi:hypothetical protein